MTIRDTKPSQTLSRHSCFPPCALIARILPLQEIRSEHTSEEPAGKKMCCPWCLLFSRTSTTELEMVGDPRRTWALLTTQCASHTRCFLEHCRKYHGGAHDARPDVDHAVFNFLSNSSGPRACTWRSARVRPRFRLRDIVAIADPSFPIHRSRGGDFWALAASSV